MNVQFSDSAVPTFKIQRLSYAVVLAIPFAILVIATVLYIQKSHERTVLAETSRGFAEHAIASITSSWSTDALLKDSAPEMQEALSRNKDGLDNFFRTLSALGHPQQFRPAIGAVDPDTHPNAHQPRTAAYTVQAQFEHGEAQFTVHMVRRSGHWQLLDFQVSSPKLLAR